MGQKEPCSSFGGISLKILLARLELHFYLTGKLSSLSLFTSRNKHCFCFQLVNVNFSICLSVQTFSLNRLAAHCSPVLPDERRYWESMVSLGLNREETESQKCKKSTRWIIYAVFCSVLLASLQFDSMKRPLFRSNKPSDVLFPCFLFTTASLSAPNQLLTSLASFSLAHRRGICAYTHAGPQSSCDFW